MKLSGKILFLTFSLCLGLPATAQEPHQDRAECLDILKRLQDTYCDDVGTDKNRLYHAYYELYSIIDCQTVLKINAADLQDIITNRRDVSNLPENPNIIKPKE